MPRPDRRTPLMASQVTLPRLGQGMESGTIVRWLKSEGDKVEKGEPLYELDTEKVTQEVEADASGVLLKILASEGDEIEVGKPIAVIGEEGEDISAESDDSAEGETEAPPPRAESEEPKKAAEPAPEQRVDGGRLKASPLARRIAKERGIDLAELRGTGPEGRIVAEDVERAEAAPEAATAGRVTERGRVETVKLTSMRRTIARRMTEAWQAPHFQITMTADMRAAMRVREALVARSEEGDVRPTFSDVLTKVCAAALIQHRAVNAHFAGDEVRIFPTANIGIAVAIPQGLVVPVIPSCERRTIPELARARADIVERARSGKLQAADFENGTFTISNLGMYGVDRFVAVLNPPQAAILAVGAIQERAVVEDRGVVARPIMEMTLSCDHRSVDGATASEFLGTVKAMLEEPGLAL